MGQDWIFHPFYRGVQSNAVNHWQDLFHENAIHSASIDFAKGIQWIAFRCLLQEMHDLKSSGRLSAETPELEYQRFLIDYLNKAEYQDYLFKKNPIMESLILEKITAVESFLTEVREHLCKEKGEIEARLCGEKPFHQVSSLHLGLSDEHQLGKSVLRLELNNGCCVYYKPRSLQPELQYQRLYHWLSLECGLIPYEHDILDFMDHGWETEIKAAPCSSLGEVRRYYQRMGIHLCLSYLFSIGDLHFENVIPCGEHPVFVDMEAFPRTIFSRGDNHHSLQGLLADSVLPTGILPGLQWGNKSMNLGALGSREKQTSSFKMPRIENERTSDMRIGYDFMTIDCDRCIPEYLDEIVDPLDYHAELEHGFRMAYECVISQKETFRHMAAPVFSLKSRVVMRHTQQYKMYQLAATFPEFMQDAEARTGLLRRMEDGLACKESAKPAIAEYEISSTWHEIVPIYYAHERDLILGSGLVFQDYFPESAQDQFERRLERLSEKDLHRQMKWIALSRVESKLSTPESNVSRKPSNDSCLTPVDFAERILLDREVLDHEHEWIGLHYAEEQLYFDRAGLYLYDGISGIAIFMAAMAKAFGTLEYRKMVENLSNRLFSYTERALLNHDALASKHTGIFQGESSIAYSYLLLYRISEDPSYLSYAKKHGQIVISLLEHDNYHDLLMGNAGAMILMLHLHGLTHENEYLEMAEKAAKVLIQKGVSCEPGIGWLIPGQDLPLAGMAHGNSGIAMAFARLWEVTKEDIYYDICLQATAYEDSLYQEATGNWADLRDCTRAKPLPANDIVAWCHGAAGILIARGNMDQIFRSSHKDWNPQVKTDMALTKVLRIDKSEYCLCHGTSGNLEAVRYAQKTPEELCIDDFGQLPLKERYQSGFMTGLSGIGYAMLRKDGNSLPNILALEV